MEYRQTWIWTCEWAEVTGYISNNNIRISQLFRSLCSLHPATCYALEFMAMPGSAKPPHMMMHIHVLPEKALQAASAWTLPITPVDP